MFFNLLPEKLNNISNASIEHKFIIRFAKYYSRLNTANINVIKTNVLSIEFLTYRVIRTGPIWKSGWSPPDDERLVNYKWQTIISSGNQLVTYCTKIKPGRLL